jgi:curved DNA-binding protein CbpA
MAAEQNHYELLGIPRNVACDRIPKVRAAWSRLYHPDSDVAPDEELLKRINDACDTLENPERRKKYDEALERDERKNSNPMQGQTGRSGSGTTSAAQGAPPPPPRGTPSSSQQVSEYVPRPPGSPIATPPRPREVPQSPPTEKLRPFLLPLLGLMASVGVLAALTSSPQINNPSFGLALIGFCCVVAFWVSVVGTFKAVVRLFR